MRSICAILFFSISATCLGAPFLNLDFESANTNSLHTGGGQVGGRVGPIGDLLPEWGIRQGTNVFGEIGFNLVSVTLSETGGGPNLYTIRGPLPFGAPLEGKYSFEYVSPGFGFEPLTLYQLGDIPDNAQYLAFSHGPAAPTLSINGSVLFWPSSPSLDPVRAEVVDVTQYAGKSVELQFTSALITGGSFSVDNIRIVPIPEPSSSALIKISLMALLLGRVSRTI